MSLGGVALPAPTADAASCALSDTVYVNPAGGVDRGGCWGYDKSHAYATIQAAVDYKNSLYTGSETSFPTLRYKPSGGTESFDNTGGIPFLIRPYSDYSSTATDFGVEGQNIEFKYFTFSSGGGIEVSGTSDSIEVISNRFNSGSQLEVEDDSEVYVQNNTFSSANIYVHDNTNRVSVWTNTFSGTAPNVTIGSVNYGNWYTFVQDQTSGGFDFVGNTVSGGQALNMWNSSGAIIMSNTVTGTGATSDTAFYLFDTDVSSIDNNTISSVGKGVIVYGWSTTPSVNTVADNRITLVNDATSQSNGIMLIYSDVNTVQRNTVSDADWAVYSENSAINLVDANTLSSSSVDFFVYQSDLGTISNNSFSATGKGIYVVENSTVDWIKKNSFAAGNAGIVMESSYGDFDDWHQEGPGSDPSGSMNTGGTNIVNNTFNGTNLGIGLAVTQINNVRNNKFDQVDEGMVTFYSSMNSVQTNTFTSTGILGSVGIDLYDSGIVEMVRNSLDSFLTGLEMTDNSSVSGRMDGNRFTGGTYGIYMEGGQFGTPLVNGVFTGNQTGIAIADGSVNGFPILFSTFYGQGGQAVDLGTLLGGTMILANNVFSYPSVLALNATRSGDLGVLDFNLYDLPVLGVAVVDISGTLYSFEDLQAAGFEANGYEEAGTALQSPGTGNFSLNASSVAVNSADGAYGIAQDAGNGNRPVCSVSDRGAYEYNSMFGVTDADADGLCNFQENAWGTSNSSSDTDGDSLTDYAEIYVYRTEPTVSDSDGDSFDDGEEILFGSDPLDSASYPNDGDHDGMDDDWETAYGLDPTDASDASTDLDSDGLSNLEEYEAGYDPGDADMDDDGLLDGEEDSYGTDATDDDTDGDFYSDGEEVSYGSDPLDSASTPLTIDSDGDGLSDYEETTLYGTDPDSTDTDADGLSDYEEVITYGTDGNDTDSDDDGLTDYEEAVGYGTDPNDADSDGDGLSDGDEVSAFGTDPSDSDSDADTFSDYEEILGGSDPLDASSTPDTVDSDGDGLTDTAEGILGTDPSDSDTDDDGLSDGDEAYTYGSDPTLSDTDSDGLSDYDEAITYGTDPADSDSDADGLSDYDEVITYGTNPNDSDSDGDGLSDSLEVGTYGTDPNAADSDGDGLSDYEEAVTYGTDANDSDSDADGLADYDEVVTYGTDANDSDSDADGLSDYEEVVTYGTDANDSDSDADGLSDYEEVLTYGTDPNAADSDGDGYDDATEIAAGSDPLDAAEDPTDVTDTDGDGLLDIEEAAYGTDPNDADTDNDGYDDATEIAAGSDPLDAAEDPTDLVDSDGDGLSDNDEATYGTDAADTDSDDDGLSDYEEVVTYGSDPLDTDSDDDLFRDDYEVSEGSDPVDSGSQPDLTLTVVGYSALAGYGNASSGWTSAEVQFYFTQDVTASTSNAGYGEIYYIQYGAFGVSWDETQYFGSLTVAYCGTGTAEFDPTSSSCSSIVEYTSVSSPDGVVTHVSDVLQLDVWSDLGSYYTFEDWEWFRPVVTTSTTVRYYSAFEITLTP
ncbi:hypothetical protein A2974_02960 [Candidatus Peregrinibacteria bacterium RIFCSPLOWO2_01_FULL_48_20]|nr:MAG: hypothetical protein A2974_02960 [Candidatus Peregrinibacteria bacterium RIFCSPLOWO2_01_FULL_48_20]